MKIMWTEPKNPYLIEVEGTPTLGTVHQGNELIAVTLSVEPVFPDPPKMGAVQISAAEWPMLKSRIDTAFAGRNPNTIVRTLQEQGLEGPD
jgi:hypothetical protein